MCRFLEGLFDPTLIRELFFKVRENKLILGFEEGKEIAHNLPELYQDFDCIDCTETKIRNSMSAESLCQLYRPENKALNITPNPFPLIKQRIKNLNKNDVLVILGSHYFGPHINKIYKNCFDIQ